MKVISVVEVENYVADYFTQKMGEMGLLSTLKSLEIDSLDLVEFVMAVEEKFNVILETSELDEAMTLQEFCALVSDASKKV